MPEARPTIEREKIKHRRPNDQLFDDGQQAPVSRRSFLTEDADHLSDADDIYYDDVDPDLTDQDVRVASVWDDEPEDDWVLNSDDGPASEAFENDVHDQDAEESGIVWEDDALPPRGGFERPDFEHPDDIAFGPQGGDSLDMAPEVELAGRRDVRPKPPRPAPPPGTQAPRLKPRRQRSGSPPPGRGRSVGNHPQGGHPQSGQLRSQQPEAGFARRADVDAPAPATDGPSVEPRLRPVRTEQPARPAAAPSESGRFSRTRATLGTIAEDTEETVLQPARRGSTPRRRKPPAKAAPRLDQHIAGRYRRRRGRGLALVVVLALVGVGGWYAYQTMGTDGIRSAVERLTTLIPLPGSSRTAADTSFSDQVGAEDVSAEQALSELEQRIRQQENSTSTPTRSTAPADPATIKAEGPPIPKFKPSTEATRSLSAEAPSGAIGDAQLAENGGGAAGNDQRGEPSIFEQLWRYLNPG